MPQPSTDRASHHQHLLHADGGGGVVSQDDHRGRVADEHDVDARLVDDLGRGVVVGGHHHDRLAGPLHLGELRQRHLPAVLGHAGGLVAHSVASSSGLTPPGGAITMLSIRRAAPTLAATAIRTGCPLSSAIGERSSAERASTYSGSTPALRSSLIAILTSAAVEVSPSPAARSAARSAREIPAARSRSSGSR